MEIQKRIIPKKETKVIILDDNALSLSLYAEEFPENFKEITDNIKDANSEVRG